MVVAPLAKGRVAEARELLSRMNVESKPGTADPNNALVPFARFENLHFARFVVLEDPTSDDVAVYGIKRPAPPVYLAFLGDFDGGYDRIIDQFARQAERGLRQIFSLCDGFNLNTDLVLWMKAHECRPAAFYCNMPGRTVRQCREEEGLRVALTEHLRRKSGLADASAQEILKELRAFVQAELASGNITLTPAESTPPAWAARQAFDVASVVILVAFGILSLPLWTVPALLLAWRLRQLETSDPEIAPRPAAQWVASLSGLEDHDVTNQFTAMGTIKPGPLRSCTLRTVLWITGLAARLLYSQGRLARVHTIHFARWVYLDGGTRVVFASSYDGSHESYMDDFVNKVAFGLNATFSSGIGYPRTAWLLLKGAKSEQRFKYFQRRHQIPTDVWYNACAGLTNVDLDRNSRLRKGIEKANMSDVEVREWAQLL